MTSKIDDKTSSDDKGNTTYFIELENGIPLYISPDFDEARKIIVKDGKQVCYILVNLESGTGTTAKSEPTLCKYINLPIGSAISPVKVEVPGICTTKPVMQYHLPPLPWVLINEVDAGFRAIDTKLHTESIVVLTYDMDYFGMENDSDGWGFIVPKQQNTGTKCDYEHDSIVQDLPDDPHNTLVVGSIHSHPGMSAYASHTDEKDQIGFDGLHITIGWESHKNGGASQYHIEFQIGMSKIVLQPDKVFESLPEQEIDEDQHKRFFDKVSKFTQYSSYNQSNFMNGGGNTNTGSGATTTGSSIVSAKMGKLTVPGGCAPPDADNVLIIKLGNMTEKNCPACNTPITSAMKDANRCSVGYCRAYLLYPGDTIDSVMRERRKNRLLADDIDKGMNPTHKIWFWKRNITWKANSEGGGFTCENSVELYHIPSTGGEVKKA